MGKERQIHGRKGWVETMERCRIWESGYQLRIGLRNAWYRNCNGKEKIEIDVGRLIR